MRLLANKRANQCNRNHPLEFGYDLDIQKGFGTIIHHSMTVNGNHFFLLQNDDITSFLGTEKPLIRNLQF
jgi:hypothetical protein